MASRSYDEWYNQRHYSSGLNYNINHGVVTVLDCNTGTFVDSHSALLQGIQMGANIDKKVMNKKLLLL